MSAKVSVWTRWVLLPVFLAGCASPSALFGETTGEKIRGVLANIDRLCRERKIGPYLDRADPEYQQKARLGNCDILRVKPFDLNEVLATPEGKFAYSIQLPVPFDKPQVRCTSRMSAEECFKVLCEKEAKEMIYRTAEGVQRVRQLRTSPPRSRVTAGPYSDEFGDPFYFAAYPMPELRFVAPSGGIAYARLERPSDTTERTKPAPIPYRLYYSDPNADQNSPTYGVTSVPIERPTARFGYLWRGVEREGARELGILGAELIVVDLDTTEVMAVRRGFVMYIVDERTQDTLMFGGKACISRGDEGSGFVARVLKPANR